ncbi:hypothetical protein BLA60_39475 [Actinophytocola xinjiangensis]|uniref:CopG-like ribbon-helix-helix domain-containing protein n=1 Tax=Actinophytocola xinjiangensis TaxID=485602 RepID=A0A7Z0WDA6_9PSEU|nr:hypothetical protein BLA60_39475 [Actinophytocola xinjiangensis]
MGARGKITQYGSRVVVRFPRGVEAQLRILASTEGLSIAGLIRQMVVEGLAARQSRPAGAERDG